MAVWSCTWWTAWDTMISTSTIAEMISARAVGYMTLNTSKIYSIWSQMGKIYPYLSSDFNGRDSKVNTGNDTTNSIDVSVNKKGFSLVFSLDLLWCEFRRAAIRCELQRLYGV